ncbi:uncharacterized protein [Dysidea avara]|uniref:uncharacterized protein isoform X2 n=1 Tax=Dysidea avara TaxID=196820 RepID=UPI003318D6C2
MGQSAAQRVQLVGTSRGDKNRIIYEQLTTAGPNAVDNFLRKDERQTFIAEQLEKCLHSVTTECTSGPPSKKLKSNPIDVIVISRLQSRYCKHLSTDDTDWPHSYIRLALVKGEKVTRADKNLEITRLTLQGQVDEILLRKEPLGGLKDIFHYKNKPCPRLILIMGAPGASSVDRFLKNCNLQVLDIGKNSIRDDRISVMVDGLEHNKTLTELNVSECGISAKGARCIGELLSNCSVQVVCMKRNNISDDGITVIAGALEGARLILQSTVDNRVCEKLTVSYDYYKNDNEVRKMLAILQTRRKANKGLS